jgi:hypothetical protein
MTEPFVSLGASRTDQRTPLLGNLVKVSSLGAFAQVGRMRRSRKDTDRGFFASHVS